MPKLKVEVKDGEVKIEGIDYVGSSCITDTNKIIELLSKIGIDVEIEESTKKPEFYITTREKIKEKY